MKTRLTPEYAEALAQAFWDKHPELLYKPNYLRFADWLSLPPNQLLPEPVTKSEVEAWLAQFLVAQNTFPSRSNLRTVMQWIKGHAPDTPRYQNRQPVPVPHPSSADWDCIPGCVNPCCEFGACNPRSDFYEGGAN